MKCRTTTLPRKSAKLTMRPWAPCNVKPGASLSIDWKYCSLPPSVVSSSLSEWADATGTIAVSDNASATVRSNGIHSSSIRVPTGLRQIALPRSASLLRPGRSILSPLIVRATISHHAVAVIHHVAHLLHHAHHAPLVVFVSHHSMIHHRAGSSLTHLGIEGRRCHNASDPRQSEQQRLRDLTHGTL